MGTKVQYKGFLPGYYAMRDLNEDADSSWSQYYGSNTLSGHHCNAFMLRPSNGHSDYDKEMLRHTMIEHEAIFRKQVYELHRLYRTQKELMDEFQKKGFYRCSPPADASQSNSFSSQIPFEGTQRTWQMPHLSIMGTSYNRAPFTSTDGKRPPLNFLHKSIGQSVSVPIEKGGQLEDGEVLDSNHRRFPRKMLDLQLPADVYIDNEDVETSEKENIADSENDVKLTLGPGEGPSRRVDSWKSDAHMQNGPSARSLADLNEPIEDICFEGATASVSGHFLGWRPHLKENQGHRLPLRSNTTFLGPESVFFKDRHSDEGTSSNILHSEKEQISRKWPFFNNESGQQSSSMSLFSPGSSKEKITMSSEPIQLKLKKTHETLSGDQNKTETWFKQNPSNGVELTGRSPYLAVLDNSGPTASLMPSSFSAGPSLDYTKTASPLVSTWTNPVIPCLNGMNTAIQNTSNGPDKRQYNGDTRSPMRLGGDPFSYPNGFNHRGFQVDYSASLPLNLPPISFGKPNLNNRSDSKGHGAQSCFKSLQCSDVKSPKIVNLNQSLVNGTWDAEKCDDSSGGFSWLRRKPACNASQLEVGFSEGCLAQKSICSEVDPGIERKQEIKKGLSLCSLQDCPSTSQAKESSRRIFGFPVLDKVQQDATCSSSHHLQSITGDSSHQLQSITGVSKCSEKDGIMVISSEKQFPCGSLVTEKAVERYGACFRNHINLNCEITEEDEVRELPPRVPPPTGVSEIDLGVPISSHPDENIPSQEELDETIDREAAKSILLMSLVEYTHSDEITCGTPSFPVPFDTLCWFAEVVSSNPESLKVSSGDAVDLFELMTLNLEETKSDEFWHRPMEQQTPKDGGDEKKAASLLLSKPRRGQARKRRQKRDFQKDILPGLASLSRHEVTEDLQAIGGLMKASGESWELGVTKRSVGRNGMNSRARGRRQPRSLAVTVAEVRVSPLPLPPPPLPVASNNSEVEVNGRSMIGWGRTTRRCRRQRCPAITTVSATLT